jgi:hypothetical protein
MVRAGGLIWVESGSGLEDCQMGSRLLYYPIGTIRPVSATVEPTQPACANKLT